MTVYFAFAKLEIRLERKDVRKFPVVLLVIFLFLLAPSQSIYADSSDQIIVEFKNQPSVQTLTQVNSQSGGDLLPMGSISGSNAMVYKLKNKTPEAAISVLQVNPDVKTVGRNIKLQKLVMPNDTFLVATVAPNKSRQWNMYQLGLVAISPTPVGGWDLTSGSQDVKIAIIDDGVNSSHEDLAGKFSSLVHCAKKANDGTLLPCEVVNSMSSTSSDHGTHIAGLAAAATNNNKGIAGAGYNTRIMMIKVESDDGEIYLSSVLNALQWAGEHGAKVVNMSFGVAEENVTPGDKQLMQAKVDFVWNRGALLVAAAGNCGGVVEGERNCRIGDSNLYIQNSKFYPAALEHVLSVAASQYNGTLAPYSEHNDATHGNWVSVAAPGGYCSGTAAEDCIYSTRFSGYEYMYGTSTASPQVAGVAALLFAVNPALTNANVKEIIERTANPSIAGKATNYGGVNALAAIQAAQSTTLTPTVTGNPTLMPTPTGPTVTPTPTVTSGPTPTFTPTPYPTTGVAKLPRIPPDPYPTGVICPNTNLCPLKTKGDADCNGKIDIKDMMKWQEYYDRLVISNSNATPSGNTNFYCSERYRETHFTDMFDYEVWRRNYSFTPGGPTFTPTRTPTPSSPTRTLTPTPTKTATPTPTRTPTPVGVILPPTSGGINAFTIYMPSSTLLKAYIYSGIRLWHYTCNKAGGSGMTCRAEYTSRIEDTWKTIQDPNQLFKDNPLPRENIDAFAAYIDPADNKTTWHQIFKGDRIWRYFCNQPGGAGTVCTAASTSTLSQFYNSISNKETAWTNR